MSTESELVSNPRSGRRINGAVVVVGVVIGLAYLMLGISQGQLVGGLGGLALMLVVTGALVIGARYSDTVALLGDDRHDERHVHIHQRAALYTLNLLAFVIVAGAIIDIARGGDGMPYVLLGGVAGVGYVGLVLLLSRRS